MNSFLWDIVSNDGVDNDLTRYTRNFFSQHLNLDELITILKLKEKYISISRLIKERFKPNVIKAIESNDEDVLEVQKDIETLLSELKRLESKRQEISNIENDFYDLEKYDSIELEKLEKEMALVTSEIAEKQAKAKRLFAKKNSLMGQKRKNDELKKKYNNKVANEYDELFGLYNDIKPDNLKQFECFRSRNILEQYEEGLKEIIPNDLERRTYMEYFTKLVNSEVDFLLDVIKVSKQYLDGAKEYNDYHLPKLDRRNIQIENNDFLLKHYCYNVEMFINGKNTNVALINSFREIKGFVDESLDYASNYEKYGKDPEAEKEKFDRLYKMYIDFYDKNEKKKPRILGVIRKKGCESVESIAYNDVVINAFSNILTYVYEEERKESKAILKSKEATNPKFKATTKKALVEAAPLILDKVDKDILPVIAELEGPTKK